jgi:hypothetical protein
MIKPDVAQLYPIPNTTYGPIFYAYAVVIPVVNTTQLPNIAVTHHLDALMWGTMARLYRMKGKPWSDPERAQEYQLMYRQEVKMHRDQANRAYSGADTPMRIPNFAPRRIIGSPWAVAD